MPSEELLRRLEALNGGPLRDPPPVVTPEPDVTEINPTEVRVASGRPIPAGRLPRVQGSAVSLAEAVPGEERLFGNGMRHYYVERLLSDHADWCADLGRDVSASLPGIRSGRTRRNQAPPAPEEVVFVDVETLGLDMQSPIFLVGLAAIGADGCMVCRQILAREPDEEHAMLAAAASLISAAQLLVTFNGRGYDMPLIRSRADYYGVSLKEPAAHIDMLLEARRRYARKLPNCRLQTLEARVCGRTRTDDVPSNRIPGVYRQFVKTGNAALLQKVIHHNLLDLATTAELFTLFFG